MSINFRSRISAQYNSPSVIDSSVNGWCCGSSLNRVCTKSECDTVSGYFIPTATNSTSCPQRNTCSGNLVGDLEGACCYWTKTNELYTQACSYVYSELECYNLHQGKEEGLKYNFYPGLDCISNGGNISCNGVAFNPSTPSSCNPDSTQNCYRQEDIIGNCCEQSTSGGVTCSISSKMNCKGYWSAPVNGVQSCVLSPCSGVYFAGVDGAVSPARASLNTLQSSVNPIEKLPNIGDPYQGGVYLGIFYPGYPVNVSGSTVYGSLSTGKAINYTARGSGTGTSEKAWILIADTTDWTNSSYNSGEEPQLELMTSVYDGLYNTYESSICDNNQTLSNIKKYKSNGFNDWYLPSQDELAFMFKQFNYGYSTTAMNPLKNTEYMSSTVFSDNGVQLFGRFGYIISQTNTSSGYGNVNKTNRYTLLGTRLVRRIYLDP